MRPLIFSLSILSFHFALAESNNSLFREKHFSRECRSEIVRLNCDVHDEGQPQFACVSDRRESIRSPRCTAEVDLIAKESQKDSKSTESKAASNGEAR